MPMLFVRWLPWVRRRLARQAATEAAVQLDRSESEAARQLLLQLADEAHGQPDPASLQVRKRL